MNGSLRTIACISSFLLAAESTSARPAVELHQVAPTEVDVDVVGDVDGTHAAPRKILSDTVWIADGRRVPTGVYLYRLETADFSMTKKMVLIAAGELRDFVWEGT